MIHTFVYVLMFMWPFMCTYAYTYLHMCICICGYMSLCIQGCILHRSSVCLQAAHRAAAELKLAKLPASQIHAHIRGQEPAAYLMPRCLHQETCSISRWGISSRSYQKSNSIRPYSLHLSPVPPTSPPPGRALAATGHSTGGRVVEVREPGSVLLIRRLCRGYIGILTKGY